MTKKKLIEKIEDTLSVYLRTNIQIKQTTEGKKFFINSHRTNHELSNQDLDLILLGDKELYSKLIYNTLVEFTNSYYTNKLYIV